MVNWENLQNENENENELGEYASIYAHIDQLQKQRITCKRMTVLHIQENFLKNNRGGFLP